MGFLEGQTDNELDHHPWPPIWAPWEMNRSISKRAPGRLCSQDVFANSPKDPTPPHPTPCLEQETETQRQTELLWVTLWTVGV